MEYLWTKDTELPRFSALNRDMTTDVLIIGGGMAGVLCALMLQEAGVDYILAEAKRIGLGITKGTTAVLTAQHDALYTDLIKKFGEERAKQYLHANLQAVEKFRELSQSIPCDFEDKPSVMYSLNNKKQMETEARAVRGLGFQADFITRTALPFEVAGAVSYPNMAQFHPLKFLAGAAKKLNILENTFIGKLDGTMAYTDAGTISAKRVIVTTHFPFINRHGMYFMKLYQKRSFVVALENAPELDSTIVDAAENGMYFRNYKNLLLVGGGDHRTGAKSGGFTEVRNYVGRWFPEAREKYAWANQDCMSLDAAPYIGRYSPAMPEVSVATGFNEWGMTSSMAAALILTDMIKGRENKYAQVFAPDRSMLRPQLFANMGASLADYIIPTTKRCSHMGCALRWNRQERSWDCSCHGSRYDEHGRLIDNPALRDISIEQ